MDTIILTGYIAGTLTTISFVPQVLRTWKLRETKDFSLAMLLLFAAGMLLWTAYGIWINSYPIISCKCHYLWACPVPSRDEDQVPVIFSPNISTATIMGREFTKKGFFIPEGAQGIRQSCHGAPGGSW